jgi:SAM-dependent methyltransferase
MSLSDEPSGYVFTSRPETPEEHRRRMDGRTAAGPAETAPAAAGPVKTFRVTAGFAEHNERLGSTATVIVRRESAPGRAEAERLVWPAVREETRRALGDGDWWPSLNWLDVVELSSSGMAEATQPELGLDTSIPNAARMYDYWLGGKDHFAADREAADRQARAIPQLPWLARQNREFLRRAVRFCAGEGITQFLDIGSGLPTNHNVHEVAQQVNPDARVVYVDLDPVVVTHARALLSGRNTTAVAGDICRPDDILAAPQVRRLIDFSQPVAVLALAVLHFIPDQADPAGSMARLRAALAPGSYLVISHADVSPAHVVGTRRISDAARELEESNRALADVPARTRDDIAGFFGDLTLVEPGLTDIWAWRPDADAPVTTSDFMRILGGVGRKD